jgi:hypothetical protein
MRTMGDLLRMRKADFWTSLVFFALAAGMIGSALTMPLKESFAGVQNAWYVSPALLPLAIATGLLLLATTLLTNAIRTGGARAALASLKRRASADRDATERMLAAIAIIAGYVYGLIPRVDYFIATLLFLQVFIAAFYLGQRETRVFLTAAFLIISVPAFVADLFGRYPAPGTLGRDALDGIVLVVCAMLCLATLRRLAGDVLGRRRFLVTMGISVVVSLLTSVSFKFGLLVPLPAEGAVIRALEAIQIALRTLGA